jgi:hypothetical protein
VKRYHVELAEWISGFVSGLELRDGELLSVEMGRVLRITVSGPSDGKQRRSVGRAWSCMAILTSLIDPRDDGRDNGARIRAELDGYYNGAAQ